MPEITPFLHTIIGSWKIIVSACKASRKELDDVLNNEPYIHESACLALLLHNVGRDNAWTRQANNLVSAEETPVNAWVGSRKVVVQCPAALGVSSISS